MAGSVRVVVVVVVVAMIVGACGGSDSPTAVAEPAVEAAEMGEGTSEEEAGTLTSDSVADVDIADGSTAEAKPVTETGALRADAPSFCNQLETFAEIDSGSVSGPEMVEVFIEFFSSVSEEAEQAFTIEAADEILAAYQPVADALAQAGGDENKTLEYLSEEEQAAFVEEIDETQAQAMVAMVFAAGECTQFVSEDSSQSTDSAAATEREIGGDQEEDDKESADGGDSAAASDPMSEVAVSIEQISPENLMSLNMTSLTGPFGELVVDSAYSASRVDYSAIIGLARQTSDAIARNGNKLVVVNLQVRGRAPGNMFDTALRLVDPASGAIYSSLTNINFAPANGTVVNAPILFEVPAELMVFHVQGGALDGDRDGYQAVFEVQLEPGDNSTLVPVDVPFNEGSVQASLVSADNEGNSQLDKIGARASIGSIDILGGEVVGKLEGESAAIGYKWLLLDAQVIGKGFPVRLDGGSVRLVVDGEWYPTLTGLNEGLSNGGIWSGTLLFEVPAETEEALLGFGMPQGWASDGLLAEYKIVLP